MTQPRHPPPSRPARAVCGSIEFRVLGPPELYDGLRDRPVPLTGPKQQLLIGALLAQTGSPVSRERLIDELWGPHPPEKAQHTLHSHVSRLRRAIAAIERHGAHPHRLISQERCYQLVAAPREVDCGLFRLAVAAARGRAAADPGGSSASLRAALALWRGSALEGSSLGPLCAGLAVRLEQERQQAMELLFDCALRAGEHHRIIPELEAVTAANPLHERFHDQLMLALCRSGRSAEAIGVYVQARHRLIAAHGHTPLLSTRLEQIGTRSPVLLAPATEGAASLPQCGGPDGPEPRSAMGHLLGLLTGRALHPQDGYIEHNYPPGELN